MPSLKPWKPKSIIDWDQPRTKYESKIDWLKTAPVLPSVVRETRAASRLGPDRVLPANTHSTTWPDGAVELRNRELIIITILSAYLLPVSNRLRTGPGCGLEHDSTFLDRKRIQPDFKCTIPKCSNWHIIPVGVIFNLQIMLPVSALQYYPKLDQTGADPHSATLRCSF